MTNEPTQPIAGGRTTAGEDGALLQERLALFARTICILDASVTGLAFAIAAAFPGIMPRRSAAAAAVALLGMVFLTVCWVVLTRKRQRALWELRAIDATVTAGGGVLLGVGAALIAESPIHVFMPFTVGILMVMARVFIVPSTARRTLWISAATFAPLTFGDIVVGAAHADMLHMPVAAYMGGGAILACAVIGLATLGTSVIFGLRREVREALRYGQYTLDQKLGEGGMGVVFKARHALLRRPTAIKLLPPHKASELDVARFEREVQLTAELTHPNTIAIFDYGRSTDGTFYYAMEYLDGVDLETLVERDGALPWARAVRILVQLCEALDEAHERGVVHRDIKPANVILCRRGRLPDFVKVVDFGLVKELATADGVTQKGTIAGTPAYMSPESLTTPDDVGPPSDLYAVGAVAYFLVTGKLVFESNTVVGLCAHHLNTAPTPPSKRTSNEIHPELERLILSCLQKEPGLRPASARALADAFAAIPANGWTTEKATQWWDRFERSEPTKGALTETARDLGIADTLAVVPRLPPS